MRKLSGVVKTSQGLAGAQWQEAVTLDKREQSKMELECR